MTTNKVAASIANEYHSLLRAITPNFIFIFNKDFTFHNIILPEGLRLFDEPENLIGQSAHMIYSPEVSQLFIDNINKSLEFNELRNIEYYIDIQDIRIYYQANIVPFEGDKAFALIQDVSDRVRRVNDLTAARERAEEADRMKTAFLANMSHEIRTPLNAIVGFSEIIAEEDIDKEQKAQYLDIIRTNNELLLKLINDILDLSSIESGKNKIEYKDIRLIALLNELEQMYRIKMKPEIRFEVIYPEDDTRINTDPNGLKQILHNFLSNAIKHTQKGSITLGVISEDDYLKFYVGDTGSGIPQDKLDKIFDRFEKLDTFVQGTGLGLSICSLLGERLGGKIEVKSEVGKGSTFSFAIPHNAIVRKSFQDSSLPGNKKSKKRKRPLILIAENTKENYDRAKSALETDYDIMFAENGQEVLDLFIQESPDLILMSIQLPVMDGLETSLKIREISANIPIVGITNDFYIEQKQAMEHGYSDAIARPYSLTALKEVVVALV